MGLISTLSWIDGQFSEFRFPILVSLAVLCNSCERDVAVWNAVLALSMTIRAALIINNHGKPRLTKFYTQLPASRQQALIKEIYRLVSKRPDGVCNFLDASELTALLPPPPDAVKFSSNLSKGKQKANADSHTPHPQSTTPSNQYNQDQLRVIYRHYATLYFVFVVDQSESELGILDLIQVSVFAEYTSAPHAVV